MDLDALTIGVLLYGDHTDLATRCLESIFRIFPAEFCRRQLRVGANAISAATSDVLADFVRRDLLCPGLMSVSADNRLKYPVLREMLYSGDAVDTEYFMWFDDDSYLLPSADHAWPARLLEIMHRVDLVGQRWTIAWQGRQRQWVAAQPWYNGVDPKRRSRIEFFTGGWWTARLSVLKRWNYPFPELRHRGGDTLLGELFTQQGYRREQWFEHVAINTEKRRGFDERPLGV